MTISNDPTAHAEIQAIRNACRILKSFQLTGCDIYSSCEPCPMCLGAIYWARPDRLFYANTKDQAAGIGFDDKFIYEEMAKPPEQRRLLTRRIHEIDGMLAFEKWAENSDKISY